MVEVEAPKGYNLLEPIEFEINESMNLEEIELLGTITTQKVTNTKIVGDMELLKIDEDTKDPLKNIEFKVECTDGFMKGKTWNLISNEDGKVSLRNLEYGKYEISEVRTLEGYVLVEKPIKFEINENGKTVKLEMTNRKIKGNVKDISNNSPILKNLRINGTDFLIPDYKNIDLVFNKHKSVFAVNSSDDTYNEFLALENNYKTDKNTERLITSIRNEMKVSNKKNKANKK
mgnify:CR=1 FL=1